VGDDAGKNIIGRKRFMTVDTGRVGAAVKVLLPVYQSDQAVNKYKERVKEMGDKVSRLTTIWTDGGFDGSDFMMWVMDVCRWIVHLRAATRTLPWATPVLKKRPCGGAHLRESLWGVADWSTDVELLPETSETFIYLAMIRIMVRRLA